MTMHTCSTQIQSVVYHSPIYHNVKVIFVHLCAQVILIGARPSTENYCVSENLENIYSIDLHY